MHVKGEYVLGNPAIVWITLWDVYYSKKKNQLTWGQYGLSGPGAIKVRWAHF